MLVKNIDAQELSTLLAGDDELLLIDVRTAREVAMGVITETPEIMPMVTIPMRMSEIPKDKKVIIYCRTGARSGQACMYLQQQGFDNVYNLQGGIVMWAQSGLTVSHLAP